MSVYKCTTCRVGFESDNDLRLHHKSEWHRFNLRMKLNKEKEGLLFVPATRERYMKIMEIRKQTAEIEKPKNDAHIRVKDQKPAKEKVEREVPFTTLRTSYNLTYSLFDAHESESFAENMHYMKEKFHFVIPDEKYLVEEWGDLLSFSYNDDGNDMAKEEVSRRIRGIGEEMCDKDGNKINKKKRDLHYVDGELVERPKEDITRPLTGLEALIFTMGETIWGDSEQETANSRCVQCFRKFKGATGVQMHMKELDHQRITDTDKLRRFEDEEDGEYVEGELEDFYDFSSTYVDLYNRIAEQNKSAHNSNLNQLSPDEILESDWDELMAELGVMPTHLNKNGTLVTGKGEVLGHRKDAKHTDQRGVDIVAFNLSNPRLARRVANLKALTNGEHPNGQHISKVDRELRNKVMRHINKELLKTACWSHKLHRMIITDTTYLMNSTGK